MAGITPAQVFGAVDQVMSRPFHWGESDCCTAVWEVFARLHGADALIGVDRPCYADKRAARRLLHARGGLEGMCLHYAAQMGLVAGHATGGIAISADHKSLFICIQPGLWAGKTVTGFALTRQAAGGFHHAQTSSSDHRPDRLLAGE